MSLSYEAVTPGSNVGGVLRETWKSGMRASHSSMKMLSCTRAMLAPTHL
jgi:hypothetical protein